MWIDRRVSFDGYGGDAPDIGDGARVSVGLCQRCVRDTPGPWLRVTPGPADGARLERLQWLMARTPVWEQPVAGEGDPLHEAAPEAGALPGEPGTHEDVFAEGRRIPRDADRGASRLGEVCRIFENRVGAQG